MENTSKIAKKGKVDDSIIMAQEPIVLKLRNVFDGFSVNEVYTDDKEVYFHERENCRKVTRAEFFKVLNGI